MKIRRVYFIILLLIVFVLPFYLVNLIWLLRSEKTTGIASFIGKEYTGQLVHNYTVIAFEANHDTIIFNSTDNIFIEPGTKVPVRYLKNNPADARLADFSGLWAPSFFYSAMPLLIILILMVHRSLIPYKSSIRFSKKSPFIFLEN